jgi:hypothetical protein
LPTGATHRVVPATSSCRKRFGPRMDPVASAVRSVHDLELGGHPA